MIVVFDTCVWVSALEFGGTPFAALKHALATEQLVISDFIEREVVGALVRKFSRGLDSSRSALDKFLGSTRRVHIGRTLHGICRDPNDDPILETAVAASAHLLVSGDKDLLSLGSFQGIEIVTPAEYLSRVHASGGSATRSTNASTPP